MPINKAMLAALSLLSYPELDVEKIYLVERKLQKLTARRAKKPWLYQIWGAHGFFLRRPDSYADFQP